MRLARLFAGLFAISLQRTLTYRAEMAFQSLMTAAGIAAGGAAVGIVFSHVHRLAGWTLGEIIVLLGAFTVVSGLVEALVEPNLAFFSSKVLNGELDNVLLQPAPNLFLVSLGSSQPWALSQALLGVVVMVVGLRSLGDALTLGGTLSGLLLLMAGTVILWSFRVLLAALAFWAPHFDVTVAVCGLWQMGRYPIDIYRRPLPWILTYVVPVAFVTTIPVHVLAHGPSPGLVVQSLVVTAGSVILATIVWRAGLRRYTGATS